MAATLLSDRGLVDLLGQIKGADSVELRQTVPDSDSASAGRKLGLNLLNAQIDRVVFFDTPDLALDRAGVVVRARRIQGGTGDTVFGLRRLPPDCLTGELRTNERFGVEVDAMPNGFIRSASMKGRATPAAVWNARCLRRAPRPPVVEAADDSQGACAARPEAQ